MAASWPSAPGRILALEEVYWQVLELRPRFPGASLIKIRPDWRESSPPSGPAAEVFRRHLQSAGTVLDVGAGDRYWKDVLERMGLEAEYKSVDVDRRHEHDFHDFMKVDDSFDSILMLELLEHLPLEVGLRYIEHAVKLLAPGGVLVISTPNAHHPHHVWSVDFTHVRPWPMHDLWALCVVAGMDDIEIYRQILMTPKRQLVLPLQRVLAKLLNVDPAYGLLLFARKSS